MRGAAVRRGGQRSRWGIGSGWGMAVAKSASEIDAHVGVRMRRRREALGISQGRLGRNLGLTFSQIQKYEKGTNRIGAGRLYQIAAFLGVEPGYFFEGLEEPESAAPAAGGASRDELVSLSEAFTAIREAETRASVLALVRSLAAGMVYRSSRG
jgi:transcriptional regulator with XRE-family HTH domain